MCTVTIIPTTDGGVRLVTNRDELRTRAAALPPERRILRSGLVAGWPTDPDAGGTWVAASSRGLCLSLLNVNIDATPARNSLTLSRGSIIPNLIDSATPSVVIERLQRSPLERFMPFRLIAADASEVAAFRWDGATATIETSELSPRCFVSSGLGDARAQPRLILWEQWLAEHGVSPEAQDSFHEHQWPDQPEVSVRMERHDARTVSVSTIVADGTGSVTLTYRDDHSTHELPIASVVMTRPTMFTSKTTGHSG